MPACLAQPVEHVQVVLFAVPGHTLIVPKMHYADVYSIPDEMLACLVASCKMHALRWRERVGATGVNILNANGVDAEFFQTMSQG